PFMMLSRLATNSVNTESTLSRPDKSNIMSELMLVYFLDNISRRKTLSVYTYTVSTCPIAEAISASYVQSKLVHGTLPALHTLHRSTKQLPCRRLLYPSSAPSPL